MNGFFSKTFGGLSPAYYLRQLFFGSLILAAFVSISLKSETTRYGVIAVAVDLTLLYPYSRFVYERVVGFVIGENVFFVNALFMLMVKTFTMVLCWGFAYVIAPVGLIYLYFHYSRQIAQ